jgi:cellulose synthase/poly-beta-1,6-N-acetylglucosamine synthase-like glycosyltransferase
MGEWILLGLFLVFIVSTAIQIFYYCYFYLGVVNSKPLAKSTSLEPLSVIICARNEAGNLDEFLPSVLTQDYPDFEVIVVNDCSEDNSYEVLNDLQKKYSHLKISTLNKDPDP